MDAVNRAVAIDLRDDFAPYPSNITIQNFTAKNSINSGIFGSGSYLKFRNCSVFNNGDETTAYGREHDHGFYVGFNNSLIENCDIYNNMGYGIHHFGQDKYNFANDNVIRSNNIYSNYSGGILISSGDRTQVHNNIIRDNSEIVSEWGGIRVDYSANNVKVFNNTVYSNQGSAGIYVAAGNANAVIQNNIVYANNINILNNEPTTILSNNLTSAPNFVVNVGANDFHLQSNSPAIDAGVNVGLPFIGSAPDIGACEYGSGLPCPPSGSGGGPSPTPPPPTSTCSNLQGSSTAVPANFGTSFNWFSSAKELLMNVICSGTSATANIGNGSNTQYIWKTGYVWQNGQWTLFNYSGSNMDSGGNWFIGNANHSLGTLDLTQKQSVLSYICEWSGTQWHCGCHDSSCTTGYWNLQQFKQ